MKKSWHPLLLKNQERVWLEEKKAVRTRSLNACTFVLTPCFSLKRRRSLTSCAKRRKRNANFRNYSVFRKSRRAKSEQKSWNGCIPPLLLGVAPIQTIWKIIFSERSGWIRYSSGTSMPRCVSGVPLRLLLADVYSPSSVHHTRVSLLFRMRIPLAMLPTRSVKILF